VRQRIRTAAEMCRTWGPQLTVTETGGDAVAFDLDAEFREKRRPKEFQQRRPLGEAVMSRKPERM
jgi:hypothetical protein